MTILIVDDDQGVRRLLRDLTKSVSTDVHESADGRDAVEYCRDHTIDLVLMDISMQKMNGIEASRRIHEMNGDTTILIVTQYDTPEYRRYAADAGASGYFLKDNLLELRAHLRAAILPQ